MTKLSFSVAEVGEATDMSERTIYRLIRAGELKAVKPTGSKFIITRKHLTEYLDSLEAVAS